jgi:hypothetical protein
VLVIFIPLNWKVMKQTGTLCFEGMKFHTQFDFNLHDEFTYIKNSYCPQCTFLLNSLYVVVEQLEVIWLVNKFLFLSTVAKMIILVELNEGLCNEVKILQCELPKDVFMEVSGQYRGARNVM